MVRLARTCCWLLVLSLAACSGTCGRSPSGASGRAGPAGAPFALGSIASPRAIATPASFDLVATGQGAVLVFAAPPTQGGVLRALALGPRGGTRGRETIVADRAASAAPMLVAEVAAASAGGRLGIAWVGHDSPERAVVFATHGGVDVQAFAPATMLGATVVLPRGARGRLAFAGSDDGGLTLAFRKNEGPCEAQSGTCARYEYERVGSSEPAPRGVDSNEVRVPCEPLLPGSVWSDGVWFSGVCSAANGLRGYVFAVREEPSYAAVHDGPLGCVPVGLVALADGAVSVSRCAEGLHVARLGADGRVTATATRAALTTLCKDGHPQLRARGDGVEITLPLGAPQSRLEALLPARFVPEGARAVWTGETLLVAAPQGADVFLRSYSCRAGSTELMRADDGA
jgi:hypothetical protein